MIRIILYYCKVQFEDKLITMEDFAERKASGFYELGQLPILTLENGTKLYQSNAIARYLGRTYKGMKDEVLYPGNSEFK